MFALPRLPSWDALHPLIIHFPIALLMVAPLLVMAGLVVWRAQAALGLAALGMMVLGTAAVFVAVATGEAAAGLAEKTPEVHRVLERHEELAETTRVVFAVLTGLYAAIQLVPRLLKRSLSRFSATLVQSAFVAAYMLGTLVLVNTAHHGGRLVHELGVHAFMS